MTNHLEAAGVATAVVLLLLTPMLDPMASLILAGGLLLSMFGVVLFERANRRDSADHTR
jgi:hypothetical protein